MIENNFLLYEWFLMNDLIFLIGIYVLFTGSQYVLLRSIIVNPYYSH